jgi:hypothetical protein
MADHYYAISSPQQAMSRTRSNIVVGTGSTAGTNPIELRVQDGAVVTAREVYAFCVLMADLFALRDRQVVVPGTVG